MKLCLWKQTLASDDGDKRQDIGSGRVRPLRISLVPGGFYSKEQLIMVTIIIKAFFSGTLSSAAWITEVQWCLGLFLQQDPMLITLSFLCAWFSSVWRQLHSSCTPRGHLSYFCRAFCSAVRYHVTLVFFLGFYFMPWKAVAGGGSSSGGNPQVAPKVFALTDHCISLDRALQPSFLLQPSLPCLPSLELLHYSCNTNMVSSSKTW